MDKVLAVMGDRPFQLALDVACGTGLSTTALTASASFVVGVDPVEAMLQFGHRAVGIAYAMAVAERLPFRARTFDLLTVASGVHWFDQHRFFAEASRVLKPDGWLVVYDHFFKGSIDQPDFDTWFEASYAQRYPPPPRASMADRPPVAATGFREIDAFEYDDPIDFTQEELISYLLSHSNTIAAVTAGTETHEATESWLRAETNRWYHPPARRTFLFRGAVRLLRPRF